MIESISSLKNASSLPPQVRRAKCASIAGRSLKEVVECPEGFYVLVSMKLPRVSIHLRHVSIMQVAVWFQQTYGCPIVIHMRDDLDFLTATVKQKGSERPIQFTESRTKAKNMATELLQCGVDAEKTFVCNTTSCVGRLFHTMLHIEKYTQCLHIESELGVTTSNNIGMYAHPATVAAMTQPASLAGLVPSKAACLAVTDTTDEPVWHTALRYSEATGAPAPQVGSVIEEDAPELMGMQNSTLFLADAVGKKISNKLNKFAVSGGRETVEEQKERGADLTLDVPFALYDLLESDDFKVESIRAGYGTGGSGMVNETGATEFMMTGNVKKTVAELVLGIMGPMASRTKEAKDLYKVCSEPRQLY
ncbi:Tryptophan--tRNA ligase [Carpediemonas membranifera]|uniref:Tryptophanyl-tRNA synthetase n=1 Tax=Carpediemonas membranifera TaxID=201153 RepID=A0A8J6E4U5_9EUKA|nr:Tryptophan--tRNA ligase [Carpediemonas membranifera]|eukprot:KAG9397643.1 Tryptophan--tRNA ligase [Carpediemonas membranifera]